MAIKWGSVVKNSGGNELRVGVDISQSPSSISSSTTSVTVTAKIYVRTRGATNYRGAKLSLSGSWSGSYSLNINHGSKGGTTHVRTVTQKVSTSFTGSKSSSITASVTGLQNFGKASVTDSITTGKRPYVVPNRPSDAKTTKSGSSYRTTWKNNSTSTKPYTEVQVERRVNSSNYGLVAKLGASATSYTDSNTSDNNQYRWRVRAYNPAGYTSYTYSTIVTTTPAKPPAPKATKSGNNIVVELSNNLPRHTNLAEIYDHPDGGSPVKVATISAKTGQTFKWTHSNPDSYKSHEYSVRVRAGSTDDVSGYIWSPRSSTSNTITLATNPGTISDIKGVTFDNSLAINFRWDQPSLGNSRLIRYEIQVWNGIEWGNVISNGTSRQYIISKAYPGVGYKIRARVMTAVSTSSWKESPLVTNGFCDCQL